MPDLTNDLLKQVVNMAGAQPYTKAVSVVAGTPVPAGRGVFIACTASGTVRLKLAASGTLDVPVNVGANMVDNIAVTDFTMVSGAATVSVLS